LENQLQPRFIYKVSERTILVGELKAERAKRATSQEFNSKWGPSPHTWFAEILTAPCAIKMEVPKVVQTLMGTINLFKCYHCSFPKLMLLSVGFHFW
jgi:hypothetical protein